MNETAPATTTTTAAAPGEVTTATTVKPGWKSSELYLKSAALLLSVLISADVIPVGGVWSKLVVCATLLLGSLGYTVSRTMIKTAAMVAVVLFAFHSTGCGASTRLKTLNATTASVSAADMVFNAFEKQHEIDLANSPAVANRAEAQALVAAFIVNRDKARKAITAALNALSAAWKLDDDTSVANAVKAATAVTAALAALGVQL